MSCHGCMTRKNTEPYRDKGEITWRTHTFPYNAPKWMAPARHALSCAFFYCPRCSPTLLLHTIQSTRLDFSLSLCLKALNFIVNYTISLYFFFPLFFVFAFLKVCQKPLSSGTVCGWVGWVAAGLLIWRYQYFVGSLFGLLFDQWFLMCFLCFFLLCFWWVSL